MSREDQGKLYDGIVQSFLKFMSDMCKAKSAEDDDEEFGTTAKSRNRPRWRETGDVGDSRLNDAFIQSSQMQEINDGAKARPVQAEGIGRHSAIAEHWRGSKEASTPKRSPGYVRVLDFYSRNYEAKMSDPQAAADKKASMRGFIRPAAQRPLQQVSAFRVCASFRVDDPCPQTSTQQAGGRHEGREKKTNIQRQEKASQTYWNADDGQDIRKPTTRVKTSRSIYSLKDIMPGDDLGNAFKFKPATAVLSKVDRPSDNLHEKPTIAGEQQKMTATVKPVDPQTRVEGKDEGQVKPKSEMIEEFEGLRPSLRDSNCKRQGSKKKLQIVEPSMVKDEQQSTVKEFTVHVPNPTSVKTSQSQDIVTPLGSHLAVTSKVAADTKSPADVGRPAAVIQPGVVEGPKPTDAIKSPTSVTGIAIKSKANDDVFFAGVTMPVNVPQPKTTNDHGIKPIATDHSSRIEPQSVGIVKPSQTVASTSGFFQRNVATENDQAAMAKPSTSSTFFASNQIESKAANQVPSTTSTFFNKPATATPVPATDANQQPPAASGQQPQAPTTFFTRQQHSQASNDRQPQANGKPSFFAGLRNTSQTVINPPADEGFKFGMNPHPAGQSATTTTGGFFTKASDVNHANRESSHANTNGFFGRSSNNQANDRYAASSSTFFGGGAGGRGEARSTMNDERSHQDSRSWAAGGRRIEEEQGDRRTGGFFGRDGNQNRRDDQRGSEGSGFFRGSRMEDSRGGGGGGFLNNFTSGSSNPFMPASNSRSTGIFGGLNKRQPGKDPMNRSIYER